MGSNGQIPVACPCGAKLSAKAEMLGHRAKCPKCGKELIVHVKTNGSTEPKQTVPETAPRVATSRQPPLPTNVIRRDESHGPTTGTISSLHASPQTIVKSVSPVKLFLCALVFCGCVIVLFFLFTAENKYIASAQYGGGVLEQRSYKMIDRDTQVRQSFEAVANRMKAKLDKYEPEALNPRNDYDLKGAVISSSSLQLKTKFNPKADVETNIKTATGQSFSHQGTLHFGLILFGTYTFSRVELNRGTTELKVPIEFHGTFEVVYNYNEGEWKYDSYQFIVKDIIAGSQVDNRTGLFADLLAAKMTKDRSMIGKPLELPELPYYNFMKQLYNTER